MMTPHEFFRSAAEQRRKALVDFAITGKPLQELVVSETPVQDACIPQKEASSPYNLITNRVDYLKN